MSRSGYSEEMESPWPWIKYRGQVASAIRGKRGQKFLTDLLNELDAMPEKKLIPKMLECNGEFCTLGVMAKKRGFDTMSNDSDDIDELGDLFDISSCLAAEIMYLNDDDWFKYETPEDRWKRMRNWVESQIKPFSING